MILVALFVIATVTAAAAVCGHQGQLPRLARQARDAVAARRGSGARLRASRASQAPESTPVPKRRPVPAWAHTEPYDYQEAA